VNLIPGEFYDGTLVPAGCGFYRNKNGKLYLKLTIDSEAGHLVYAWWCSGEMAKSLRDALPSMGVDVQEIGEKFYRAAREYIAAVPCRFKIIEDTNPNTGKTVLKIGGVWFGSGGGGGQFGGEEGLNDEDIESLQSMLAPADDSMPF
jgi:hypothetical protein